MKRSLNSSEHEIRCLFKPNFRCDTQANKQIEKCFSISSISFQHQPSSVNRLKIKTSAPSQPSACACLRLEGTHHPRALIQFPSSFLSSAVLLLPLRMIYRNSSFATLPGGSFDGLWRGLWKVAFESIPSVPILCCVLGLGAVDSDLISIIGVCVLSQCMLVLICFSFCIFLIGFSRILRSSRLTYLLCLLLCSIPVNLLS